MLGVVVKGGTQAGRRIIRKPKTEAWACECPCPGGNIDGEPCGHPMLQDPSTTRCPDCGTRRP